jgi:hypothetical protein
LFSSPGMYGLAKVRGFFLPKCFRLLPISKKKWGVSCLSVLLGARWIDQSDEFLDCLLVFAQEF